MWCYRAKELTDTIKFIKLKIRRSSSILQMGPIYSTGLWKQRFLSSWVPRDSVERKEAGEIQIMRGLPITAGLARDIGQRTLVVSGSREWCLAHVQQVNFRLTATGSWTPPKTWVNLDDSRKYISPVHNVLSCGFQSKGTRWATQYLTFDTWKLTQTINGHCCVLNGAVSLKHQQKTNTITMNPFDLNRGIEDKSFLENSLK